MNSLREYIPSGVKALWILLAVVVLAIVVIFVSISKGWIGYMPPVEELENPNYKFATEIFSEDGKVLGTYSYSKENRVFVGYNDLSPHIINALIATEDVPQDGESRDRRRFRASGWSSTARRVPACVRVMPFSVAIAAVRGSPR